MERTGIITMKGNPLTLVGTERKVGDKAPEFTVLANNMSPVKLSDSAGHVRLISVVTSLDTSTCDMQTVTFNKKAAEMSDDIKLLTVSVDLPFAQSRFCAAKAVERLQTVSDYRDLSFGQNYGLVIKELRLLARAVLVVDKDDTIRYMQIVPEVSQEPDYDAALTALQEVVG